MKNKDYFLNFWGNPINQMFYLPNINICKNKDTNEIEEYSSAD